MGGDGPHCSPEKTPEKKIKILSIYFFFFFNISPWKRTESQSFPITQGCFMPCLVEISTVVLEKQIFKFHKCNSAILLLSPLGRGRGPSFEQTWIPFTQGCFGWNWPSGSGEEDENVKSLQKDRQTDRQTDGQTDGQTDRWTDRQTTDDRWSEKLTWAFSSGELKSTKMVGLKDWTAKDIHTETNRWTEGLLGSQMDS